MILFYASGTSQHPIPTCNNFRNPRSLKFSGGNSLIGSEKVSGGSREGRPELATIIDFLRPGDELVVTRLDRLGRDTRVTPTFKIVHRFTADRAQNYPVLIKHRELND